MCVCVCVCKCMRTHYQCGGVAIQCGVSLHGVALHSTAQQGITHNNKAWNTCMDVDQFRGT